MRLLICCTSLLLLALLVQRRHRPTAHYLASEYACPDKCDPRCDELQAWATLYEREAIIEALRQHEAPTDD